jgi:hypothetical protein
MGERVHSTLSGSGALDLEGVDLPAGAAVRHSHAPPLAEGELDHRRSKQSGLTGDTDLMPE